jgi:esterase/lipase
MKASDGFSAGVLAIEALTVGESADPAIDPRCLSFVLHHGRPTERAIVLFHGFTNCPRQFAALAELLFAHGFNVYVPRLPRHGLLDKLTAELAGLRADELAAFATQSAYLGGQLGTTLCVLGLSVGATLAAWVAQTEPVARAVAIAPFFSVVRVPSVLEPALAGALALGPNLELWWDPRMKEKIGPAHGYPRFATHALAQCLEFGETVRKLASDTAPRAACCVLVLNAKDPAIDNPAARDVWSRWQAHGATTIEFTFDNLDPRHDIIEPTTYPQAPTLVYPELLRLLDAAR